MKAITVAACVVLLAGCQSAYYGTMEKFGVHKREILVDRVEEAQQSQEEVKEQFASALEHFAAVVNFDGGDLEDLYEDLNSEFEDSEARAQDVRDRIEAIEDVAMALFEEWEDELEQYSSADLKRKSQQQLRDTRQRYSSLMRAMYRAEERIAPVLDTFRDQVLFLKHNLNARAISSIKGELATVERDVQVLIEDMNRAISEASDFIATLES